MDVLRILLVEYGCLRARDLQLVSTVDDFKRVNLTLKQMFCFFVVLFRGAVVHCEFAESDCGRMVHLRSQSAGRGVNV